LRVAAFAGALSFAGAAIAPHPAQACGRGGGSYGLEGLAVAVAIVGVVVVATDVGFGVYDIAKGVNHERVSDGYAAAEIIVMLPQSVLFYSAGADNDARDAGTYWTFGLIPTAMLVHGIATLSTKKSSEEVVSKSGAPLSSPHGPSLAWTVVF
jgi:hypothetical protein